MARNKLLNAPPVAVDVFCGAAGLSLGLKESGISIAAGIDLDPACRFPFEENIGGVFLQRDAATLRSVEIKRLYGDTRGVRVLAGCAPCQPFSGYTTKRRAIDDRWQLLLEFLRLARGVRPEIVTLENVPRLTHLPLWSSFVHGLEATGYHVAWGVLDASSYGVPQARRRLVLLASLMGPIGLPPPVAAKPTVRSVLAGLPKIEAGTSCAADPLHACRALTPVNLRRIRASRPAGTWREWPSHMRVSCHTTEAGRTYPSVYGRMSWDQPAPTITTQFYGFGNGRFGHPEQDRAISLREGALLQSFPSSFKFAPPAGRTNFREIGRLIGNAVPPALARAIGKTILDHAASFSR